VVLSVVLSVELSVERFHVHMEDFQDHTEDTLVLLELIQELMDLFRHPHMVIHIIDKNEKRQKNNLTLCYEVVFCRCF
jgi:hypothetical protein